MCRLQNYLYTKKPQVCETTEILQTKNIKKSNSIDWLLNYLQVKKPDKNYIIYFKRIVATRSFIQTMCNNANMCNCF